jgi:glycosyltransferase involved in cell wall biosynthesis
MPAVSVIIPVHNRAGELPQTIKSVLAQTSSDWEIILVDDHSTDGADRVARDYAAIDSRIRAVALPDPKRGAPAGRNFGFAQSAGEFVIFLDSDDLLLPDAIASRLALLRAKPELDFAVSRTLIFKDAPHDGPFIWTTDTGENDLDRLLRSDVPWSTQGPMWRRTALQKLSLGGDQVWDESVLSGQDWEFHIRAVASGLKYERIDAVDSGWRIAGPTRDSIGKSSFVADHARARPIVVRKMYDFINARGLLDENRKQAFAALYLSAVENLATLASRKEARTAWAETKPLGLMARKYFNQVSRYLLAKRWPSRADKMRLNIERDFPRGLLPRRGKHFHVTPADPTRPPAVSVVMSAYNNVNYVTAAVKSILQQSFRDFEFIIIDDGSTDGTGDLLRRHAESDSRIRLVQRENKGLTVSLNEGLAMARAPLVARMDSDDIAGKERFEKQVAFFAAHPDVVALGTRIETIDPYGSPLDKYEHKLDHDAIDAELIRGSGWALVHPTVMMRADALKRLGGYRAEWNNSEDLDLFLRLAEIGRVANLPDVMLQYRQHLGSVNHLKFENQMRIKKTILEQAHARRGTKPPTTWDFRDRKHVDPIVEYFDWGWKAHKHGNYLAARRHAMQIIKRKKFNIPAWKLWAVALRDERREAKRAALPSKVASA